MTQQQTLYIYSEFIYKDVVQTETAFYLISYHVDFRAVHVINYKLKDLNRLCNHSQRTPLIIIHSIKMIRYNILPDTSDNEYYDILQQSMTSIS